MLKRSLLVGLIAVVLAFGVLGHKSDGFIFLYSEEQQKIIKQVIDGDRYVRRKYAPQGVQDGAPTILVVGDSFAADIRNALTETRYLHKINVDFIAARCGGLYISRESFKKLLSGGAQYACDIGDYFFENLPPDFNERMIKSDLILLASYWQNWNYGAVPISVRALEQRFGSKILVLGSKNFGTFDLKRLLEESNTTSFWVSLAPNHVEINDALSDLLQDAFFDLSYAICESRTTCRLFDSSGNLLSHDGGHLTEDGARFVGEKLILNGVLSRVSQSGSLLRFTH